MTLEEIIIVPYSWAKHFLSINNEELEPSLKHIFVRLNPGMCIYLNTDGAIHFVSSFFAASGVIRDGKGNWILGYNCFLGRCLVAVAEI